MKMTEAEILRDYREAKAKNKQIEILADMNLVTKKEMAQFLAENGMQVDKRLLAGDPRKRKDETVFIPDEPEPELTEEQEEKFQRILDSVDAREPLPARKPLPDQTAKADAGKPKLSLVPMQIMFDVAEIREYGCQKYKDPDNWKKVEPDRYVDALLRHILMSVQDRNSVDAESGLSHLSHAACNMAFLCEMYHGGRFQL